MKIKKLFLFTLIWIVISFSIFLIWPAQKNDFSACPAGTSCFGEYTSQIFGGLNYLTRDKTVYDGKLEDKVYFYDNDNLSVSYELNTKNASIYSLLLGGSAVLVIGLFVSLRKHPKN